MEDNKEKAVLVASVGMKLPHLALEVTYPKLLWWLTFLASMTTNLPFGRMIFWASSLF
jgi:hypothetical protein